MAILYVNMASLLFHLIAQYNSYIIIIIYHLIIFWYIIVFIFINCCSDCLDNKFIRRMAHISDIWKYKRNPGPYLDLNDKCKSVFPSCFDGFRVMLYKSLSRHFRITHNIYISSITPGNYRFGATYAGNKEISPHYNSPMLYGDIGTNGSLNSTIAYTFGSRLKVRFDSQMEQRLFVNSQLTAHYFGDYFTASAIVSNADVIKKSGGFLFQFLHSVTPNLDLGIEVTHLRNLPNLSRMKFNETEAGPIETVISLAARYSTQNTIWSGVGSLNNCLLCCYKRASDQIEFGIELDTNLRTNIAVGSFAYLIRLKDRGVIFRGSYDSNSNVGSVFEKRICGTPFAFSVSANLNHSSNNFRLGLGFIIE